MRVCAPAAVEGDAPYQIKARSGYRLYSDIGWADLVHVHGARSPYAVWASILSVVAGKPVVYTPHCYYDDGSPVKLAAKRLWDYLIERWLLGRAVTILLDDTWLAYLRSRHMAVARPVIVPNCLTAGDVMEAPAGERDVSVSGNPAIISVGRLAPVKRLDDGIRALRRPELAQAQLHIVGKGPARNAWQALAEECGVGDRVHFYGFVADDDVAAMARKASVFLLPSAEEGFRR